MIIEEIAELRRMANQARELAALLPLAEEALESHAKSLEIEALALETSLAGTLEPPVLGALQLS
jgi:hypothetical protein